MKDVFISYSMADRELADEIGLLLEKRGLSCWIAPRDVSLGKPYGEEIIYGIEDSIAMVLVLSEHANQSAAVQNEVERAFSKGKTIIPVRIREVQPSKGLEFFVASAQWLDAWKAPIETNMDKLAAVIAILAGREPAVRSQQPLELHEGAERVSRLLVYSGRQVELRNPPKDVDSKRLKAAVRSALVALGASPQGVRIGDPALDHGHLTYPIRQGDFGGALFDSVHFDVWKTPEVEVTFFLRGHFAAEAPTKSAIETPAFLHAAREMVQLLHPDSASEAFVSHHFHSDLSGHFNVAFYGD